MKIFMKIDSFVVLEDILQKIVFGIYKILMGIALIYCIFYCYSVTYMLHELLICLRVIAEFLMTFP